VRGKIVAPERFSFPANEAVRDPSRVAKLAVEWDEAGRALDLARKRNYERWLAHPTHPTYQKYVAVLVRRVLKGETVSPVSKRTHRGRPRRAVALSTEKQLRIVVAYATGAQRSAIARDLGVERKVVERTIARWLKKQA